MSRALLQQALKVLEAPLSDDPAYLGLRASTAGALREALAAPEQEPVALESVHLTRDTRGMCVVRVNGRVAIRDNGDIIDHMATLEWFAAPPAAPAPAQPVPLTQDQIADCTRTAHRACDAKAMTRWSTEFARAIEAAHGITGGKP